MHDRWLNCVQNHTALRYVRGWERVDPDKGGNARSGILNVGDLAVKY